MPLHETQQATISVEDDLFNTYARGKGEPYGAGFPSLTFQFLDFSAAIDDSIDPSYKTILPVGRPAEFLSYEGSKNRLVRFTAMFFDEDEAGYAVKQARILQSLKLPWRRNDVSEPYLLEMLPPPRLRLALLQFNIWIMGRLSKCSANYSAPLVEKNPRSLGLPFVPSQVTCSCEFIGEDTGPGADFDNAVYGLEGI